MNIKELPESERPYEKLELYGEKNLTNAELLAIIIKTGTKEKTSVQLAQEILSIETNGKENIQFLQDVTLSIDNYTSICKEYEHNNLYLTINATDYNTKTTIYKIPLKLENCTSSN